MYLLCIAEWGGLDIIRASNNKDQLQDLADKLNYICVQNLRARAKGQFVVHDDYKKFHVEEVQEINPGEQDLIGAILKECYLD